MKKLLALSISLIMVLAAFVPCTSASAADPTGTITINNVVSGQTYSLYRIMNVTTNDDHTAFVYTPASNDWKTFFKSDSINGVYINVDAHNNYITWITGASQSAFAKLANEYADANEIDCDVTEVAGDDDTQLVFTDMPLGYYLLDSSLGALCSLTTTKPDATLEAKNVAPTIEKQVREGTGYTTVNDASIGDTIEYRVIITAYNGAESYVLHDKMDTGIEFDSITKVERTNGNNTTTVLPVNYTVDEDPEDGDTFDITIAKSVLDTLQDNEKLTVYYTATLTSDASISNGGNKNTAYLSFGRGNQTASSQTITYTWDIPVLKYTMIDGTETPLAGAEFILYYSVISVGADGVSKTTTYYYAQTEDAESGDVIEGWTTNKSDATVLTSDSLGKISIQGIDSGAYYLEEIKAPAGYNMLSAPVTIAVTSKVNTATNTMSSALAQNNTPVTIVKIENKTGNELPSTGGIGTTVFYIVGGVLVVGAVIFLVTKKRMDAEQA